jgi:GntR family transcriptional regulator
MQPQWDDNQPIYRQVKERVLEMILDGDLTEGDALPSVRTVSAEYQLNPLTVLKGYQELVDEGLVEKQRGKGMFVTVGARERLLKTARSRFLSEEWPRIRATIGRLGIDVGELIAEEDGDNGDRK